MEIAEKRESIEFSISCDSDWGRDKAYRRSVTGYVGHLCENPIVTRCCYQHTIAQSSAEAEYMAMANATKEVLHMKNLFSEFTGVDLLTPVIMHVDNKAAIAIAKNPMTTQQD